MNKVDRWLSPNFGWYLLVLFGFFLVDRLEQHLRHSWAGGMIGWGILVALVGLLARDVWLWRRRRERIPGMSAE